MTSDLEIKRAHLGVTISFLALGFCTGNFISRIPDFKEGLQLSNSALGISLLIGSLGVLVALAPAGKLTAKYGSATIMKIAAASLIVIQPILGLSNSYIFFSAALFISGMAMATQDVGMNTHGVTLEQKSGNRFMSRFHAFWSVGGLLGTFLGGLLAQFGLTIFVHYCLVSVLIGVALIATSKKILPADADKHEISQEKNVKRRRPRLIFIMGLLGLAGSIGEGSAGDWGGVLARETFGASPFVSSLPYIAFSFTMVVGRFFGDQLATKFGAQRILKAGGVIGGVGLALGLFIGGSFGVILGWFLFGTALSSVIPLLFSAAGSMASKRYAGVISPAEAVAMISGISYFGFVVGPPMMGFIADAITLRWAMLVPAVLAIVISANHRILTSE